MLTKKFGRELPEAGVPFGESWEIVDREEAQSVVVDGAYAGKSLNDLWTGERDAVFGETALQTERFPVLAKILDARDNLSLQVHPPPSVAGELEGEPKTEVWYIADADPGACLYVGLENGVDRESFGRALEDGSLADVIQVLPVAAGDFIFIPSGRLHAIGAGLVIYEIQQNSDTTYRVFDWNRVGLDGQPRALHVEESLRCIDFGDHRPGLGVASGSVLVDCECFRLEKEQLGAGEEAHLVKGGKAALVTVVRGKLDCGTEEFGAGDFFLVPACAEKLAVRAGVGGSGFLVTYLP